MSKKISISIDDEVLNFVDTSSKNRSSFINEVLSLEKKRRFEEKLAAAYQSEANDPEFLAEVRLWDVTLSDGLEDA